MYVIPAVVATYDAREILGDAHGTICTGSNCPTGDD